MKQTKFQCIGGVLSGSVVQDNGSYFYNSEVPLADHHYDGDEVPAKPVNRKYRKLEIKHPNTITHFYYVCETMSDEKAREWVNKVQDMC